MAKVSERREHAGEEHFAREHQDANSVSESYERFLQYHRAQHQRYRADEYLLNQLRSCNELSVFEGILEYLDNVQKLEVDFSDRLKNIEKSAGRNRKNQDWVSGEVAHVERRFKLEIESILSEFSKKMTPHRDDVLSISFSLQIFSDIVYRKSLSYIGLFCKSVLDYSFFVIFDKKQLEKLSLAKRHELLAAYAESHSGPEVAAYALALFPPNERLNPNTDAKAAKPMSLPTVAPETWLSGKAFRAAAKRAGDQPETPPEFVRRVYGQWEHKGLSRNAIRKLDKGLMEAYYKHVRQGGKELDNFYFPTESEILDREVEQFRDSPLPGTMSLSEARRIGSAINRRREKE